MSKHDDRVLQLANSYKRKGYKVQADIRGFKQPEEIGKNDFIPDLVASKAGYTKIVEVETQSSLQTDKEQLADFMRSASHRKRTSFELYEI